MAIFGALVELPLAEVLTMLGRRSGKLKIWDLPKGRLEMHLSEAHLKAMVLNGQPLVEIFDVRETITSLMQSKEGEFEFERLAPEQLLRLLDIPLERLMVTTMDEDNEIETYRNRFAHPSTRFRSVNSIDIWIYDDLYEFWQRSADFLAKGSSAEELSKMLDFPLEHVQLKLYKLRSLGKVSPVRAFYSRRSQAVAPPLGRPVTQQPATPSYPPVQQNVPTTSGYPAAAQSNQPQQQPSQPISNAPIGTPSPARQRTLVTRLLKALQIGKRT